MNHIKKIIIVVVLLFGALFASAWQGPTDTPPNGNVDTLLNTSSTSQTKAGYLYFPKWFDSDDDEYYVDPDANSIFARIYTNLDIRAPKFFDLDDIDYYVDPASTSRVNSIVGTGTICDKNGCIGDVSAPVDLCVGVTCDDYCDSDDATRYYDGSCSSVDGSCSYESETCSFGCDSGVCSSCSDSSWTPVASSYCNDTYFTQTSNCGTTKIVLGTKIDGYCSVCSDNYGSLPVFMQTGGYFLVDNKSHCSYGCSLIDGTWSKPQRGWGSGCLNDVNPKSCSYETSNVIEPSIHTVYRCGFDNRLESSYRGGPFSDRIYSSLSLYPGEYISCLNINLKSMGMISDCGGICSSSSKDSDNGCVCEITGYSNSDGDWSNGCEID